MLQEIGLMRQNEWAPFWTDGSWSLHELLEFIMEQTGPADVCLSSYSISEASVRCFYNLLESGNIKKLTCLFDQRIKKNKPDVLLFASNLTTEIYFTDCHAKLITISNDIWKVVIIGSANFTVNKRYECGVICTIPDIVNKFQYDYNKTIKDASYITKYDDV
jgi:hypothetical protein